MIVVTFLLSSVILGFNELKIFLTAQKTVLLKFLIIKLLTPI